MVQFTSIGLDNGLAPKRRQAIIWTKAGAIYWRVYVVQGEDSYATCFL